MNSLAPIDITLLEDLKARIEQVSGLDKKQQWVQKDFEFLIFFIHEKTGVHLSLSTVKRIWRNEFQRLPHVSTLNTLANLAYNKDWLSLKKEWLEKEHQQPVQNTRRTSTLKHRFIYGAGVLFLVCIVGFLISIGLSNKTAISPEDLEQVTFSYQKSVEGVVPNTVVFHYNIESVEADSFFLQQSWDRSRRVQIFKGATKRTDIYYVPGFFIARLIANDQVIKEAPIHITYEDWFMAARQPMSTIQSFDKSYWLQKPYLGTTEAALQSKKINLDESFQLAFYYV